MSGEVGDAHETNRNCHGAEHFLVGLSPQYWAHTPLAIADICGLGLINGIDCLMISKRQPPESCADNTSLTDERRAGQDRIRILPLSKCLIQGVIVTAEQKSNGSVIYLVDDGTGFIDCIAWSNDDLYSLPPLLDAGHDKFNKPKFRVGDVVLVMGKIRCVAVGQLRQIVTVSKKIVEVHDCVREIKVSHMELVENPSSSHNDPVSMDHVTNHWVKCVLFKRRASLDESAFFQDENNEFFYDANIQDTEPILSGRCILELLGKDLSNLDCLPAAGDLASGWRVFGINCKCKLSYKESLLYCHCQATREKLDPFFKFRDALLDVLVSMERDLVREKGASADALRVHEFQLRFTYKDIVDNAEIASVAAQVVANTDNVKLSARRLFIHTFRALRKDGILHLVDEDSDLYMLVSREGALAPYLRTISCQDADSAIERRMLREQRPPFLSNVPNARLQYVRRCDMS